MAELAACLHCGCCEAEAYRVPNSISMECNGCHAMGPPAETLAEAIAAWNKRYVRDDKNGEAVYAGQWCNFISDADPPVKVRFVWIGPDLRYLVEDEQGLTYPPPPIKSIELIKKGDRE